MKFVKNTVKLGDKERLDSKQTGNSKPFCQFTKKNSEQSGVSEQFCDGQKVPYHQA